MTKRILFLATLVLVSLAVIYFFFLRVPAKSSEADFYNAVPKNAAVVFKINQPLTVLEKATNNQMWMSLSELNAIGPIHSTLMLLGNAIKGNILFEELLKENQLVVSLVPVENSAPNTVAVIQLSDIKNYKPFRSELLSYCKLHNITVEEQKEKKVHYYLIDGQNSKMAIGYYRGMLFFSNEKMPIEDAIDQLTTEHVCDPQFLSLLKTAAPQAEINAFIQHSSLNLLLETSIAQNSKNSLRFFDRLANWSELDIQLDDNKWLAGGFSTCSPDETAYIQVIKNQKPYNSTIDQLIPPSTHYFMSLSLSDPAQYFQDYEKYLDTKNLLEERNRELKSIEIDASENVFSLIKNIFDNETATGALELQTDTVGYFWILKTQSGSYAFEQIEKLQAEFLRNKNISATDWVKTYSIDDQTSVKVIKFPFPRLPKAIFGDMFENPCAEWVAIVDNYLVFGSTFETVSAIAHANILGQTLSKDLDYGKFKTNLSDKSTINFYCNLPITKKLMANVLVRKLADGIVKNDEMLKFKNLAWQISTSGEMVYNNVILDYSPEIKKKSKAVWQCKLASYVQSKPQFVRNPMDVENFDILVQDGLNKLYLINYVGRIIWQMQLESPIMGKIHTLDYFKNGKPQFLFNTEDRIYLIDREGNNLSNFPVNLRSKATNGVSVFDYESNKNYRFFVACIDRNIYGYDENGKILEGWDIFKTDHLVKQPVQHIRVEGKDFIVASDEMKDYFLHRKGTVRIDAKTVYQHSPNNTIFFEERTKTQEPRFVTTDNTGKLHYTYLDGKHEVVEIDTFSAGHFFISANIDDKAGNEYIMADSTTVSIYSPKREKVLVKKFETPINFKPEVFSIAKNKMIGITLLQGNKIMLFGSDGTEYKGFPFEGNTPFSISTPDGDRLNLVTGVSEGYLNFYVVE